MTMIFTSERRADATAVAAMPVAAIGLDISHVMPTPAERFAQRRELPRTARRAAVAAILLSIRDAVTGPPATEQERWQRKVAAARQYSRYMLRW